MKRKGEEAGLMAESARENKLRAQLATAAAAAAAAAPGGAQATAPASGAYGQVKRRSSAIDQAKSVVDDDE